MYKNDHIELFKIIKTLLIISLLFFLCLNIVNGFEVIINTNILYPHASTPDQKIDISWRVNYQEQYKDIKLKVTSPDGAVPINKIYPLNDVSAGQHSLNDTNTLQPPNQEGIYLIELGGTLVGDRPGFNVRQPFRVERDLGNLLIIKFDDKNSNGIKDDNEEPLAGWSFKLGAVGETPQIYPNITNQQGRIEIRNLPTGPYVVEEEISNAEWTSTNIKQSVMIYKDKDTTVYFGNIKNGTLQITKFADLNGNGKKDASETGIPNWRFLVTGNRISEPMTTGPDGLAVSSFRPGAYVVRENPQPGWTLTTSESQPVTIKSGEMSPLEFGNKPVATIVIKGYWDENGNGIRDSREQGMPGWTYSVQGQAPMLSRSDGTATISVVPGAYSVAATPPSGFRLTMNASIPVTVSNPGETKEVEFRARKIGATIVISKFEDLNENGVRDSNEPNLSGWRFKVDGVETEPTGQNGTITISIPATSHTVTEIIRDRWIITTQTQYTRILSVGEVWNVTFGNKPNNELQVFVFNDKNQSGKWEGSELGLGDWEITLVDNNGAKNIIRTNATGYASCKLLPSMDYSITIATKGYWINTTRRQIKISTGSEPKLYPVLFGEYLVPGPIIEILKFNDTDGDKVMSKGEQPLSGWTFRITGPAGSADRITGADGRIVYDEDNIAGNYTVEEINPIGSPWRNTTETPVTFAISRGQTMQLRFGNSITCPSCGRCEKAPKPNENSNADLNITKLVRPDVLTPEAADIKNGTVLDYTIKICPKQRKVPTDLILLVDTSGSLWEFPQETRLGIIDGIIGFAASERALGNKELNVGLVSWDEVSKVLVAPTRDYNAIIAAANNISFNSENKTFFQVGLDGALNAFNLSSPRPNTEKVIAMITDARGGQSVPIKRLPGKGYHIYVLLVGGQGEMSIRRMLENLTEREGGKVIEINDPANLAASLSERATITANANLRSVQVIDTLPNYMTLINNSISGGGKVKINGDGKNWNTTTISWNASEIDRCWNTTFQAVFCWRFPANAYQRDGATRQISEVRYINSTNGAGKIEIPESEIRIISGQNLMIKQKAPSFLGFEALAGLVFIMARRRRQS